jgi:polyol transport system substrate-binding protein
VQPRPAIGIRIVGIPEFADLATKVSQEVAAEIAGNTTVDETLPRGQRLPDNAAMKYRRQPSPCEGELR